MNGWKSEFPDEDAKIYWILSYMTLGATKTWRDYVVSLMYRQQHNFSFSDELLQEIHQKFRDTDKRTTQSLKICTMQQKISLWMNTSEILRKPCWKLIIMDTL